MAARERLPVRELVDRLSRRLSVSYVKKLVCAERKREAAHV